MGNLDKLTEAGLILKDLPDAHRAVMEDLPEEHVNVLLDVKKRLDDADAAEGATPVPPFAVFLAF